MSLNEDQQNEAREALHHRREQLREEILGLITQQDGELSELHGRVHDSGDESIADVLADTRIAGLEQFNNELIAIESALDRLRTGRYGWCQDCGEEIPWARLQAQPAASRCVSCQERAEDNRSEKDSTPSL